MRYKVSHIVRLRDEVSVRYNVLLRALATPSAFRCNNVVIDGSKIRMAVDDFKSVLSEIRRLK